MYHFLNELRKTVKDYDQLSHMLDETDILFNKVFETIDEIMEYKEDELEDVLQKQEKLEEKVKTVENTLVEMHKDIYEDEDEDFEIVCPYCNYEFDAYIDETKKEITCPECENIIELDWE